LSDTSSKHEAKPHPAKPRRDGAKLDDQAKLALTYYFAQGLPVPRVAHAMGVSEKTVRTRYISLRDKLIHPTFNKWHGLHRTLIDTPGIEEELGLRSAFVAALARCYGEHKCYRNFIEGGRKERFCRNCRLPFVFTHPGSADSAIDLIDATREFYERLHIRGERATDPVLLFAKRLVHTVTIQTAIANSERLKNGLMNPTDENPLSVAELMHLLFAS